MNALTKGIRFGLTAAIVVMVAGALHGCTSDSPTEVSAQKQSSDVPGCYLVNGVWYCSP
jgi:hypothetical protein